MSNIEEHKTSDVVEGSLEKPAHLEHFIRLASETVCDYFEEQGFFVPLDEDEILARTYVVDGDQIHLRAKNGRDIKFPLYAASYDAIADKIFIKIGEKGIEKHGAAFLFRVLMHELVHLCQVNYLRAYESKSGKIHIQKRGGYHLDTEVFDTTTDTSVNTSGKLAGLNEALTDMIAVRAIESAEVMDDEYLPDIFWDSYPEEKRTFVAILERIANVEGKSYGEIEHEFMEGYIMGNMMHLRRVEKYFGNNALKVLSMLGS